MSRAWSWCVRNRLWLVSVFISIASAPGDGGYLTRFVPAAFAYTWNFAVDAATELIGYAFVAIQKDGRISAGRKRLSWLLIPFQFGLLYYAIVFAHAEFATQRPDTAPYLLWSLASFGPAALTGLGIAQAVTDTKPTKRTSETGTESEPEPSFACGWCGRSFGSQNALNSHRGRCKAKPSEAELVAQGG